MAKQKKITRFMTALFGAAVLGVVINMALPVQARIEANASDEDVCVRFSGESVVVGSCDESSWIDALASANPFSNVQSNFRDPIY